MHNMFTQYVVNQGYNTMGNNLLLPKCINRLFSQLADDATR